MHHPGLIIYQVYLTADHVWHFAGVNPQASVEFDYELPSDNGVYYYVMHSVVMDSQGIVTRPVLLSFITAIIIFIYHCFYCLLLIVLSKYCY